MPNTTRFLSAFCAFLRLFIPVFRLTAPYLRAVSPLSGDSAQVFSFGVSPIHPQGGGRSQFRIRKLQAILGGGMNPLFTWETICFWLRAARGMARGMSWERNNYRVFTV